MSPIGFSSDISTKYDPSLYYKVNIVYSVTMTHDYFHKDKSFN